MPMDNVTLENTQQSISSRDAKSVASVMVNGKWVNLSDTLEQANVKSDVGTVAKQVAAQQEVVSNAVSVADSAQSAADAAVENSLVNSQAIEDINSAVSDATSDAAVARSDGLRAWNAAQSNVNLIDLSYASASASISSARTEALAAADDAKKSANAAQADIVVVKSSVAAVQADVTATKSDVAVAKSDIADTKTNLTIQAKSLSSYAAQASAEYESTASALSDAKATFNSDVAVAKDLASTAQSTAGSAVKSASSVADDLTTVASQAKANASGITKVTSDVGLLQATVADNSGNISTIQETAKQIQQAVSDNAGNITVANQTADSAATVASDARSNVTVAIQTASQASVTAKDASGQAASSVLTANGAMTTASNAKSDATVAIQTASGASLTATNAKSDAMVAKQTASEASLTATNAKSDFAQLSFRADKIEANVANNSGAIASVQQTANGLTTTVGKVDDRVKKIEDNTNWTTKTGALDMDTLTTTQNIYYRDTNLKNADGETGWAYIQVVSMGERVTQTVWHDRSSIQHTRTGALNSPSSNYNWDAWNKVATNTQVVEVKQTVDGITTTINDPKTGLNATYQTAAGNSTTISNVKGDVSQLKVSASSASVALSDAAGNISSLKATASELETKYADAAGDISKIKTDAKGMTQTISNAQGDIAKLKTRADGFDAEFSTANGNISKLQTDATGTKQTMTNAKSDIAVLQSRADGIDAKYANAAGDINTLKVDASGMKQTLTNAKGDISTLQSTATGFKNTLSDAQGNISTLQSDVSGLKKTTSDHNGNIATLQATAKTLTSQMSSAQGDISTLKQTASGFSSKVSGMETSLANANSKINDITSNGGGRNLLTGTQEWQGEWWNLSRWEVDAETYKGLVVRKHLGAWWGLWQYYDADPNTTYTFSFYAKASEAGNFLDIFTLDREDWSSPVVCPPIFANRAITTEWQRYSITFTTKSSGKIMPSICSNKDGITIYAAGYMLEEGIVVHPWTPAPEDTDAKITTNSTAIEQNRKAITLKADQTTVDKANGTVQQLQSQLKVQAGQINSKVSSSDLDAKGYATQTYTQTQVKQTADAWNANLTSVKNGLTQSYTNLHATVDGIQAEVYNKDGSSKITQLSNVIQTKVGTDDFNNLKQAVGLQTLESADINNMKTTGHYFVHNLSNNPIGGWVYVDVTGDGSSRIRQDVYQDSGSGHKYRRLWGSSWTDWEEGATYSEINQLKDDINLRVTKGDLISQINLQAGATLIQSNKLVLDAKTTVFTGDAFIPDAYISTLNADKLMFYGSDGTSATMGASVAQYDDDKTKSTINLQYSGGIEIHSSDQQGSILTMHDNTIRLASKSWGDNPNAYQYSGFYAAPNYSLMNTYHRDGTTSGVAIDDNQIHIYGSSKDQQLGALKADVGWYSINGKTGSLTGDQISLKATTTQVTLSDRNINIENTIDTNDKNYDVAIHIKGWAEMTGWFTCMGLTQTSLLSAKTRIEPLDTAKALELINSADVTTYQYKQEVAHGGTKRHASVIIDDVNDVARYQTPDEFISEDRQGRNDGDIVGYLMGAVQELTKKFKTLESKVG